MLTIRQEKPEDYRQVEQVVEQAFARAEHTDHDAVSYTHLTLPTT